MIDEPGGTRLTVGINEPVDPVNLSDLEKKHLPVIDAPDAVAPGRCFDVTVEVGRLLPHPAERGHFIQSIQLFADETFLACANLTAATTGPKVTFRVCLQYPARKVKAVAVCNLHGAWAGHKAIAMEA